MVGPLLLCVAAIVPFAAKPLHVDDPMFVAMADAIRRDPARPYAFRAVWDREEESGARIIASPPFYGYVLAAARAAFGEGEAVLRLAGLPFALLLVLCLASLARRFGVRAWAAALLAVTAPAFVVLSQMAMPDLVLASLVTAALAAFVSGFEGRKVALLLASGVALGLAVLTRYNILALVPVLLGYAWLRRGGYWRAAAPATIALLLFVGWNVFSHVTEGEAHFLASLRYAASESGVLATTDRLLATAAVIGGVTIFPGSLLAAYLPAGRVRWLCWLLAGELALGIALGALDDLAPAVAALLLPVFLLAGLLVLGRAVVASIRGLLRRSPDVDVVEAFLSLWALAILLPPLVYIHSAAKFVLPALPALAILYLRRLPEGAAPVRRVVLAASGSLVVALGLALTDYRVAQLYRDAAEREVLPLQPAGREIAFGGHWGWQHYLERSGARALTWRDDRLRPGDLVAVAHGTSPRNVPSDLWSRSIRVREIPLVLEWPLRLMDRGGWAGFYASAWGMLPYTFVAPDRSVDRVTILRVTHDAGRARTEEQP
jgi:4-amino-4-deoxy-L-arabinose transferase-like glycosyltransferase